MAPPDLEVPVQDPVFAPPHWVAATRARKAVEEAASAAALLGVVFAALGALVMIPVVSGRMRGGLRLLAGTNALILIGPGVWYFLAASMIRRIERRAAAVALRVAGLQGILVAAGLLLTAFLDQRNAGELTLPAMVATFFMPALGALAYHLWRARQAMNLLGGGETGFEALAPRPVIPLAPEPPPASVEPEADELAQGSNNVLGK